MSDCTAICSSTGRKCSRRGKYQFCGSGRSEWRCPVHAYEWLGGNPPAWVESVVLKGVPRSVHRGAMA